MTSSEQLTGGQPIRVDGLVARPEFNGRCGTFLDQEPAAVTAARAPVRMDGDRAPPGPMEPQYIDKRDDPTIETLMVRYQNLRLCHTDGGAPVHIVLCGGAAYGLQARPGRGGYSENDGGGELAAWRLDLA